jgi:hypothetical protein
VWQANVFAIQGFAVLLCVHRITVSCKAFAAMTGLAAMRGHG